MNELVARLAAGQHPVSISTRPEASVQTLKECIDRGYVHVTFTDTRGGTELGIPLNETLSEVDGADFDEGRGSIKLVGDLTLNYEKVRCIAQIDLKTLSGQGRLEVLNSNS